MPIIQLFSILWFKFEIQFVDTVLFDHLNGLTNNFKKFEAILFLRTCYKQPAGTCESSCHSC